MIPSIQPSPHGTASVTPKDLVHYSSLLSFKFDLLRVSVVSTSWQSFPVDCQYYRGSFTHRLVP